MKTSKQILLAMALVLMVGSFAVATAQSKIDRTRTAIRPLPPQPIGPSVTVSAIEVNDGTMAFDSGTNQTTTFGYTFLGRTTGDLPGSFTLSMNCVDVDGQVTNVTGGSWTLPVYFTNFQGEAVYQGSLYGTVTVGQITSHIVIGVEDKQGVPDTVVLSLSVDGGTQTWNGTTGTATFDGFRSFDKRTGKLTITGNLVMNIPVTP